MKMLCVCGLALVAAAWAADRPGIDAARLSRASTAEASLTDFECMEAGGSGASLCWTTGGTEVCAEGVEGDYVIVDTGHEGFGTASVGHERVPCITEMPSSLMLTFDPPVESWQMSLARDDEGELRAVCWAYLDDVGDETKGRVFESSPADDVLPVGNYSRPGTVACAVQAVVDNIIVY